MKKIILTLTAAVIIAFSGCSTAPISVASSNTPIQNKIISENLGFAKGEYTTYSVLSLWMVGRPEIDVAVNQAIALKGGDALINIKIYEKKRFYLIFSTTTVIVEGEAVKLTDPPVEKPAPAQLPEKPKQGKKK